MSEQKITPVHLIIAAGIVFAGCVFAAIVIGVAISHAAVNTPVAGGKTAPPVMHLPDELAVKDAGGNLVGLGNGSFVWRDADGKFFLMELTREKTLAVREVYRLVKDDQRHWNEPEARRFHGYYMDALSNDYHREVARRRKVYEETIKHLKSAPADEAADRLGELGDVGYLKRFLQSEKYVAWRSAALALGKLGYSEAAARLLTLLPLENNRQTRKLITEMLGKILGEPFTQDVGAIGAAAAAAKWEKKVKPFEGDK
jgi:hypothetical protein